MASQCREHQYPLGNYYCMECNTEQICLQCIVQGKHADHQVNSIEQSYQMVQTRLAHQALLSQEQKHSFLRSTAQLDNLILQQKVFFETQVRSQVELFAKARRRLQDKEKEVMQHLKAMQNRQYENMVRVKSHVEQEVKDLEGKLQGILTL